MSGRLTLHVAFALALATLVVGLAWHEQPVGMVADDAIYLLMADRLSAYLTGSANPSAFIDQYTQFPPLYPLVLAVFGGGSEAIVPARLASAACLLLGLFAIWAWLRREIEPWAGALTIALGVLPGMVILALDLRSEHLYLALSIGALYFAAGKTASRRELYTAAALVGLAVLARTAGISLVLAFACFVLWNRIERGWALVMVSSLPLVSQALFAMVGDTGSGYGSDLVARYRDDIVGGFATTAVENLRALWAGWVALLGLGGRPFCNAIAALIAAPAGCGLLYRLTAGRLDALYLAAYLGMLVMWPAGSEHARRFLVPVVPVALCHAIWMLQVAVTRGLFTRRRGWLPGAYLIVLLGVITPALIAYAIRFAQPLPNGLQAFRYTGAWIESENPVARTRRFWHLQHLVDAYRLARDHIPSEHCVFVVHPEVFMFNSRRLAFPPPGPTLDEASFEAGLRRCRYVFISSLATHPYLPPAYPLERLGERRVVFTTKFPGPGSNRHDISTALLELLPRS